MGAPPPDSGPVEGKPGAGGGAGPVAKPKIFVFVNGRWDDGDVTAMAMAEDGHVLAQHLSSSVAWAQSDMGVLAQPIHGPNIGSTKHAKYEAHYPGGYELIWVEDAKAHAGIEAAYALNQQLPEEA